MGFIDDVGKAFGNAFKEIGADASKQFDKIGSQPLDQTFALIGRANKWVADRQLYGKKLDGKFRPLPRPTIGIINTGGK